MFSVSSLICVWRHRAKSTCKNEGRDWGDGKPKIASKPQEAKGEAWNSLPHSL